MKISKQAQIDNLLLQIKFLEQKKKPTDEMDWIDIVLILSGKAIKTGSQSKGLANSFIYDQEEIDED